MQARKAKLKTTCKLKPTHNKTVSKSKTFHRVREYLRLDSTFGHHSV